MGERRRAGFALFLTVLALVALTLLAHGLLLLARAELSVARAAEGVEQARGQARRALGRLRSDLSLWPTPGPDSAPSTVLLHEGPEGGHRLLRSPLGREWWLLEARGWAPGGRVEQGWAAAVWAAEPGARVAAFASTVEVVGPGEVRVEGSVQGGRARHTPEPAVVGGCARADATLDSLGLGALPGWARRPGAVGLGALSLDTLLGRLPSVGEEEGTPESRAEGGACREGAWSWGDPRTEAPGPCARRWVGRGRRGSLTVSGGFGQGLLVVSGDLNLTNESNLRGVVLVGGTLVVGPGSRFQGLAQVGALEVARGGEVEGSACPAYRALGEARPMLEAPAYPPGRPWPLPGADRITVRPPDR